MIDGIPAPGSSIFTKRTLLAVAMWGYTPLSDVTWFPSEVLCFMAVFRHQGLVCTPGPVNCDPKHVSLGPGPGPGGSESQTWEVVSR